MGTGKLDPEMVATAITGVANACGDHGVALLGGETAEMPGVYPDDEFDLVGTLVGVVERDYIIDGSTVEVGDQLIGLPSIGLHTNGYSLARRIVEERMQISYTDTFPGDTRSAADVLLDPHLCYLESLRPYLKNKGVHALAHITGGGVPGNLPRVLNGLGAAVSRKAVPQQNVFTQLCEYGNVERDESWKAFNMGVGMILVVSADEANAIHQDLDARGEKPFFMGEIRDCQGVEWLD
jgi:phosphoribosylformylglycinamidine cyclo-ligase